MTSRFLSVLVALLLLSGTAAAQGEKIPVDLELAFVVDASGSIDDAEMALQRKGYADALSNPRVLDAIKGGFLRSIAVAYVEFSGWECTRIAVGWTRIHDAATARAFGDRVLSLDRNPCFGGNAIGEAVALTVASLDANEFEGTRRVIDVSGDGPNTKDPPIELIRDQAEAKRIIINALAIHRPSMPDLPQYYKQSVTGGPGSFVIEAESRQAFAKAILRKMIREIVQREDWEKRHAAKGRQ